MGPPAVVFEIRHGGNVVDAGLCRAQASADIYRVANPRDQSAVDNFMGSDLYERTSYCRAVDRHGVNFVFLFCVFNRWQKRRRHVSQKSCSVADDRSDAGKFVLRALRQILIADLRDATTRRAGLVFRLSCSGHDSDDVVVDNL